LEGRVGRSPFVAGGLWSAAPRSYPPEVVDVENNENRRAMLELIIHCEPYSILNDNKSISVTTNQKETAQDLPQESATDIATIQDSTQTTHTSDTTITHNTHTHTTDSNAITITVDNTHTPNTHTAAHLEESKIIQNNSNNGSIHPDTQMEGTISLSYTTEISSSICPICLDEFKENDLVNKSKRCSHIFHKECILSWLDRNDICPCCRNPMITGEELRHAADARAWALFVGESEDVDPLPTLSEDDNLPFLLGGSHDDDEDPLDISASDDETG